MNQSRKWVNASIIGVLLVLLFLFIFQIYNYFFLTLKTEYAIVGTIEDEFDVKGIVCRDEHVLAGSSGGYHDIVLKDGEKVSKGGTIANIYNSESDVKAQEKVRLLQAEIDEYTAAFSSRTSYSGDNSAYEQSIQSALSNYAGALNQNDAFAAQEALKSFEKGVFVKEIVTGDVVDYQQEIQRLRGEISELQAEISGTVNKMTADGSGYYSRNVDGFEGEISPQMLSNFTIAQYNELSQQIKNGQPEIKDNIGKIVSGYNWNYYFIVPSSLVKNYKVGQKITFKFPSVTEDKVNGTIQSLKIEGDNALIGVSCAAVHSDFLSVRTLEGFVVTRSYDGLRVDKNALRMVDGKSGVYVKVGQIIRFKQAEVLYSGTSYALLDPNGEVDNFDEVIIGGRNLYDGKAV